MGTGRVGIIFKAPLEVGEPGSRPGQRSYKRAGRATQAKLERLLRVTFGHNWVASYSTTILLALYSSA